jgi:hypothetical protein
MSLARATAGSDVPPFRREDPNPLGRSPSSTLRRFGPTPGTVPPRTLPRCPCGCGVINFRPGSDEAETWVEWTGRIWLTDALRRFWDRVDERDDKDCWEWAGTITSTGYGTFSLRTQNAYAHRIAYECAWGPIPEGLVVDHLCANRRCCNPLHLEAVTVEENNRRGPGASSANLQKDRCPRGHPYSGKNLGRTKSGSRYCRTCTNDRHKTPEFRARRRERRRGHGH